MEFKAGLDWRSRRARDNWQKSRVSVERGHRRSSRSPAVSNFQNAQGTNRAETDCHHNSPGQKHVFPIRQSSREWGGGRVGIMSAAGTNVAPLRRVRRGQGGTPAEKPQPEELPGSMPVGDILCSLSSNLIS